MFSKKEKKESVRRWRKALFGKIPYIFLAYILYPFIPRTKVREKHYSKDNVESWWNRQLWYLLNDDELGKYGDKVDWDPKQVAEKGIDTSTNWGKFKATHWFNVSRNIAYNYSQANGPINPEGSYSNREDEINEVFKIGKSDEEPIIKIDPIDRAEWRWVMKSGKIGNKGDKLSLKDSRFGEGLVWFNPNGNLDYVDFRYSKASKFKLFGKIYYITLQYGAWTDKYDIVFKIGKEKS